MSVKTKAQLLADIEALKKRVIELQAVENEPPQKNGVSKEQAYAIGERINELNCLYGISHLVETPGIALPEILQGIADLLPPAWQCPQITCARIMLNGQEYKTGNFRKTKWKLASEIKVGGTDAGSVEVFYLEGRPKEYEGPFLKEERALIDAVAERLGRIIHRVQAQEKVEHLNLVLQSIRDVNQLIIREKNRGKLIREVCSTLTETRGYSTAWVMLLDGHGKYIDSAESGLGKGFTPLLKELKQGKFPACVKQAQSRSKPITIDDPSSTCADCTITDIYSDKGRMTVQLEHAKKVYGVLSVSFGVDIAVDEEELSLFDEVAGDIAFALYNIETGQERDEAEAELLLKNLAFDASISANSISDTQGTLIYVNETFLDTWGYSNKEEVLGKPISDFLSFDDEAINIVSVLNETESWEGGYTALKKDKTTFDAYGLATVIKDKSGKILGYQSVVQDISKKKQAEKEIISRERFISNTFNAIQDGISVLDTNLMILRVNSVIEELYANQMPLVGKKCYQVYQGRKTICPWCPSKPTLEDGKRHLAVVPYPNEENPIGWIELSSFPLIDTKGKITGVIEHVKDITTQKLVQHELEESLEYQKTIFETTSLATAIIGEDSTILNVNTAFEIFSGFSKEELEGKKRWTEFVTPEDLIMMKDHHYQRRIDPDTTIKNYEFHFINRAGDVKNTLLHVDMIPGTKISVASLLDITERVQAEQEFELLLNLSRQANTETKLDDLLFFIANQIVKIIPPAEAALIFLYNEKRKVVRVQAWAGSYGFDVDGVEFEIADGQVGRIFRTKKPALIRDVSNDPDFQLLDIPGIIEIKSQIIVPFIFKERVVGVIYADNLTKTDAFSQKNLDLLESIGNQLAGTIENSQLFDQVIESEEQYHSVVDDSPGLINRFLPDGTITFTNKGYRKFFGKKSEELIGTNIQFSIPEEYRESVMLNIASLTKKSPIKISENRNIRHDGEIRWLRWTDRALFDDRGKIINFQSFGEDITESKQAQRAIQQEKDKAQKYLDIAEVMIVAINKDGEITLVNQKGASILGYKIEELIGKNWFNTCVPTADRKQAKKIFDEFITGGVALGDHFEQTIVTKSGEEHIIDWHSTPLWERNGEEKHRIGSLNSGEDITERKLAKDALQNERDNMNRVFEAMVDGVYLVNKEYDIQYVNPVLIKDFGPYEGRKCYSYFHDRKEVCPWCKNPEVFNGETVQWEWYSAKNQRTYDLIDTPLRNPDGSVFKLEIFRDITERVQNERELLQSERRYKEAESLAHIGHWDYEPFEGKLTWSEETYTIFEIDKDARPLSIEDFLNRIHSEDRETMREQIKKSESRRSDYRIVMDDGSLRHIHEEVLVKRHEDGEVKIMRGTVQDITEQVQAEQVLKQEQEKAQRYLDIAGVALVALNQKGAITLINQKGCQILGYQEDELIGVSWFDACLPERNRKEVKGVFKKLMTGDLEPVKFYENPILTRSGEERIIAWHNTVLLDEKGRNIGTLSSGEDITERKLAEKSTERLSRIFEGSLNEIYLFREDTLAFIQVNNAAQNNIGFSMEELRKMTPLDIKPEITSELFEEMIVPLRSKEQQEIVFETVHKRKDQSLYDVEVHLQLMHGEDESVFAAIILDITKRIRAEQLLSALNQAAVAMGTAQTHQDIFNAVAEELKQIDISCILYPLDKTQSKLFTKYVSFESAAITTVEKLMGLKHKEFYSSVKSSDIYQKVVREKKACFTENSGRLLQQIVPKFAKKISPRLINIIGNSKAILSPLIVDNKVIGVFSIQSRTLTQEDIPATTAFADQLSSAWNKIKLLQNLRKTVEGTIHAIAATVEARDPYTAGHQGRVADLTVAISKEMGLSKDQTESIRMAGLIHDLGKINIPAEILSKPGELSELEYKIIQTHPQVGFDLLKKIEFPWPIAGMVHQHHEKMDGSGYPQGLIGDDILLEARILAVADIVEAMSSHRPYRPALGIEKALAQIREERGTLLDPEVVDACLKIFKEGYKLPEG